MPDVYGFTDEQIRDYSVLRRTVRAIASRLGLDDLNIENQESGEDNWQLVRVTNETPQSDNIYQGEIILDNLGTFEALAECLVETNKTHARLALEHPYAARMNRVSEDKPVFRLLDGSPQTFKRSTENPTEIAGPIASTECLVFESAGLSVGEDTAGRRGLMMNGVDFWNWTGIKTGDYQANPGEAIPVQPGDYSVFAPTITLPEFATTRLNSRVMIVVLSDFSAKFTAYVEPFNGTDRINGYASGWNLSHPAWIPDDYGSWSGQAYVFTRSNDSVVGWVCSSLLGT
jgi:hypothetical protein